LDIQQEVSTIGETDGSTGNPIISQRTISSAIAVDSGETIALGGLFEQRNTNGTSGLPGLARQPIFGGLFGRQSRTDTQTELLVLITPRIVNNAVDSRRITRSLRERMENIRLDDATLSNSINIPSMQTDNSADISSRRATQDRNLATQSDVEAALLTAVETAALAPAPVVATQNGTRVAYLGGFDNENAARAHWSSLLGQHGSALSGLTPDFVRNDNQVRVAVGPMDATRASQLCAVIRSECFSE